MMITVTAVAARQTAVMNAVASPTMTPTIVDAVAVAATPVGSAIRKAIPWRRGAVLPAVMPGTDDYRGRGGDDYRGRSGNEGRGWYGGPQGHSAKSLDDTGGERG